MPGLMCHLPCMRFGASPLGAVPARPTAALHDAFQHEIARLITVEQYIYACCMQLCLMNHAISCVAAEWTMLQRGTIKQKPRSCREGELTGACHQYSAMY